MATVDILRRALQPLASRKVRVAVATVIAAYAAEYGLGVSEDVMLTILSVGVALILGIAHEDAGKSSVVTTGSTAGVVRTEDTK